MIKTGKHGYLDEIFETEEQFQQIKNTIYDVNQYIFTALYRVVSYGNNTIMSVLWRCGVYDMIKSLEELITQPSQNASHDALDEKMERQIQDLRYLLKILEKLELDFIFINN
jgi:hypothetical protein